MIRVVQILFLILIFLLGQSFSQTLNRINYQKVLTEISGKQSTNGNSGSELKLNNQSQLTDEFLIDTNLVSIPQLREQEDPSITFDGTNYFVVWSDYRSAPYSSTYYDIYGTRVSQDGKILDPGGIAICTAASNQAYPKVAFNGTEYLVAWEDRRDGVSGNYWDIYGARVSTTGNVLDPDGIALCTEGGDQRDVSIATDGLNFLVAWDDGRNNNFSVDLYGTRVDGGGNVLDPSGIAICSKDQQQQRSSIAFDGNNYMVVWEDSRTAANWSDIYAARVSTGGIVLDTAGIEIHTGLRSDWFPSIAFDGTNYLIVWCHSDSTLYGSRITTDGNVLNTVLIDDSPTPRFSKVSYDGTNYLVVWEDIASAESHIYGKRVSSDGILIDSNPIVLSNSDEGRRPSIAVSNGTDHLVVWMDFRSQLTTYSEIYGSRINLDGNVLDPSGILISRYINPQNTPAVAFDGTNYLIVWQDYRNVTTTGYDIYGARVAPNGSILDPSGFAICTAIKHQWQPSVAFDGTNYLVTWDDQRNFSHKIYGARVSAAGNVLDTAGIEISIGAGQKYNTALAFDGTNYFVVWEDGRNSTYDLEIYGARVSTAGNVLDPDGINLFVSVYDQVKPAVAFDGINYLVVWQDDYHENIDGVRVNTSGTVLDASAIHISTEVNYRYSPSLSFDGTNYLVIWEDWRNNAADIYSARVNPDGTVLNPSGVAICTEAGVQTEPTITFNGVNYFAAWTDYRNGNLSDIYGAKLDLNGSVINSFIISNQDNNQLTPVILYGQNEGLFVAYSGFAADFNNQPVNTIRIWGNFVDESVNIDDDKQSTGIITSYSLNQNYPNPFNPSTKISWQSPVGSHHTLKIYDVLGNEVATLVDKYREAGKYEVEFNGHSDEGQNLSSGVYFYRIQAGSFIETKKMILIK